MLETNKSLDVHKFVAALLSDVQTLHSEVITPRDIRLDISKCQKRVSREGMSFLTKALPRLAKAFDRALTGEVPFDSTGFRKKAGSQLPSFLGGLFERIFSHDAVVLPLPCVRCIATVRQVLYLFYKYELDYSKDDEQAVISDFSKTEEEVKGWSNLFLSKQVATTGIFSLHRYDVGKRSRLVEKARKSLYRLFQTFDYTDVIPCHGPGAVSTRETLWDKWTFRNVSARITSTFPLDAYFFASLGHVCDHSDAFNSITESESSARVVLVPKDSRGPRLISCEPLDFQWIQQGVSRAIVDLVESHPLTKGKVNFSDQTINREGARKGSLDGSLVTLDLKEASDRVSVGLVRLLFPEHVSDVLMNCRSLSTVLPSGEVLELHKYAPMGSALCFPVLALTVWSLLYAGAPDADTREGIFVYGDDVIVPKAYALNAIELLEEFGLKINRTKSCITGFFRESCGMDAYKGVDVTPVRFRTRWSSTRCASSYTSWISYANSLYDRGYTRAYWHIADRLISIYREIPSRGSVFKQVPGLAVVPLSSEPKLRRYNKNLQRLELRCWSVRSRSVRHEIDGWAMLLRYFTEGCRHRLSRDTTGIPQRRCSDKDLHHYHESEVEAFNASVYTKRGKTVLTKKWISIPLWGCHSDTVITYEKADKRG